MNTALLVISALLPAILLCIYVYRKDRVEKEPIGLLLKLLIFGAISCFPAGFIEVIADNWINRYFPAYNSLYLYSFVKYFFGVALVEEGCKYFILVKATAKNREFNSLFDGLIYSIFVSLGFAALENVFYVLANGFGNAVMRAILSVPGHMFFAVMMGYYYCIGHVKKQAAEIEESFFESGLIAQKSNKFTDKGYGLKSLIVPTFAHGFYNFCCVIGEAWALLVLVAFVVFMYIFCFRRIRRMSKSDNYTLNIARYLVLREYPHLVQYFYIEGDNQ